jgi:hypothetical protein
LQVKLALRKHTAVFTVKLNRKNLHKAAAHQFLLYALQKVGHGGVVANLAYHTPFVLTLMVVDGELLPLQRLFIL